MCKYCENPLTLDEDKAEFVREEWERRYPTCGTEYRNTTAYIHKRSDGTFNLFSYEQVHSLEMAPNEMETQTTNSPKINYCPWCGHKLD